MDEFPCNKSFEKATVFEFGYIDGFSQFEVRWIRFHIASPTRGGEYEAATFVERGKRKEKTVAITQLVVIEGWGHPKIDRHTIVSQSKNVTIAKAKFSAFSTEWDDLLDRYLVSLRPQLQWIVDGRNRPRLTPRSESGQQPAKPPILSNNSPQRYCDDANSTRLLSEGAVESLLMDRYERDPNARRVCLDHYGYTCRICEMAMSEIYGDLGNTYVHVHHKFPLSDIRQEHQVDPIRDLVPVCPNCHAMLHRSHPPLSVEELTEIVRNRRRSIARRLDAKESGLSTNEPC